MSNYLWYLSPEASALSFFDEDSSVEIKRKMVTALSTNIDLSSNTRKFHINFLNDFEIIKEKEMDYFITDSSLQFFDRFDIDKSFLQTDVESWSKNENFLRGLNIVKDLQVVNDTAERTVHLVEEYLNTLTTDKNQKQYLIQVVSEYKKSYPDANKETLHKKIKTS